MFSGQTNSRNGKWSLYETSGRMLQLVLTGMELCGLCAALGDAKPLE